MTLLDRLPSEDLHHDAGRAYGRGAVAGVVESDDPDADGLGDAREGAVHGVVHRLRDVPEASGAMIPCPEAAPPVYS
ncbi:hypothetical protein ACFV80_41095 [Streptomyces sp. NPDC059862]|uniref:hypothetical protein n=1 Tax=Streptomyces sp. NPDC059862 TaxID=3346975 RepID=UPI0036671306